MDLYFYNIMYVDKTEGDKMTTIICFFGLLAFGAYFLHTLSRPFK